MRDSGARVVFDATHSVQLPGGQGSAPAAGAIRAAAGACRGGGGGGRAVHGDAPRPARALSDSPNAVPLKFMRPLLESLRELDAVVKRQPLLEAEFAAA